MGAVDTEAVILRTYKLAEADKIVVCLTRNEGLVRGVARGARRLKSRFGASLEPFTHTALTFYAKEGRELVTFSRIEIIKSYFALSRDPEVVSALEYLSQLVMEFAPPHQADEKLFRLLLACFESAARDPESTGSLRPYFELWLLKLNGFLPDLSVCARCEKSLKQGEENLSLTNEGTLLCGSCADGPAFPLTPGMHRQLLSVNKLAPGDWARQFQTVGDNLRRDVSRFATNLVMRALDKQPDGRGTNFSTEKLANTRR
jgi:DNA repair protein RecO (recombination protein O)